MVLHSDACKYAADSTDAGKDLEYYVKIENINESIIIVEH